MPRGNSLWRGPWLRKPGRWVSRGSAKAPLVWGSRAGTKAPMVEGPWADEIAPVGSPEGEARLVRSTEQRSWPGDATGAESTLAKMSEAEGRARRAVLRAHILRAVVMAMLP